MAKAFFRFLRGELNGYYITAFNNSLNKSTEQIKAFFSSFSHLTFKLRDEVEGNEYPISETQLKGIGIFAGVFSPWAKQDSLAGTIKFTPSHIVDDREYSERGLFNMSEESFDFFRTDEADIDLENSDINVYATSTDRTSFVEDNPLVLGYFAEGETIINPDGSLNMSKLLLTPPEDKAYVEYYGDKYLFLTENTDDVYKGSLQFTDSFLQNDKQYSSMCLFNFITNSFNIFSIDTKYLNDINTLANDNLRTSVVEIGARIIGYIQEGDRIIREDGTLDFSKILNAPPEGKAYSEWYGKKYLFLSEAVPIKAETTIKVYYAIIKAMQWVRYNGCSIESLCKFIEILCPDYLFLTNIEWTSSFARGIVNYGIDKDYETSDKLLRTEVFKMLISLKFPQYVFNEVEISVTRDSEGKATHVEVLENN